MLPDGETCENCFWWRVLCWRYGREANDDRCIVFPAQFEPYSSIYSKTKTLDNCDSIFKESVRKKHLIEALEITKGVQKDAAKILGITPRMVNHYCKLYSLQNKQKKLKAVAHLPPR